MSFPEWKIHGGDTIAAYVPDSDFRCILEKRLAIPPDHLAILIRDGEIAHCGAGAHFAVGGVFRRLGELFTGHHALRLLVADLKPFAVTAAIKGFSKDGVKIPGEITLELQLNPERPADIMGLISNNRALTRSDVYARLRPHWNERVLVAELVQHEASELRANAGLQDRIQAEIMKETQRVAGDIGLIVRATAINWGLNEDEAQAIRIRGLRREDEFAEFQQQRLQREQERAHEATVFEFRTALDFETIKSTGEHELAMLFQKQQVEITDARDTDARLGEAKALQHELEMARTERRAAFEEQLAGETNELERKTIELSRRKMELEFEVVERRQALELDRLTQEQEIALKAMRRRDKLQTLESLSDIDEKKAKARHDRAKDEFSIRHQAKLEEERLRSAAELDRLRQHGAMTPEQVLAGLAGLSPEVARVFAERAKAEAAGADQREQLLRELLEQSKASKVESEQHAHAMFDKALDRISDVAAAAVSGSRGVAVVSGAGGVIAVPTSGGVASEVCECPACHHAVPVSDRFCKKCGHKMRT